MLLNTLNKQVIIPLSNSIRVATINVHMWDTCWIPDIPTKPNHETLSQFILEWMSQEATSLDFIALEEVASLEKLSVFAKILGFPYYVCSGEGVTQVGFLSKFPILSSQSIELEQGIADSRMLLFLVVEIPIQSNNGYLSFFS